MIRYHKASTFENFQPETSSFWLIIISFLNIIKEFLEILNYF